MQVRIGKSDVDVPFMLIVDIPYCVLSLICGVTIVAVASYSKNKVSCSLKFVTTTEVAQHLPK